ncbi:WD40 repeat-like protein [Trichoderma longibrachiatum ATCC 18648]|uniref:WD40 repeat-like protein n=1 Tax=Trichoderma longibrachiatum ATCC 18648 TaxID=983965 RepID=A0A2T4C3S7_TRILO|nr:WD40 repeat-like protein [Trichoderma longibrachiatum ATCC 18648]
MPRKSISAFFRGLQAKSGQGKGRAEKPSSGSRDGLSCLHLSRRSASKDSRLSTPRTSAPVLSPPDDLSSLSVSREPALSTSGNSLPAPPDAVSTPTAETQLDEKNKAASCRALLGKLHSALTFPDIEAKMTKCQTAVVIDLEMNEGHVTDSVDAYVRAKIQQLNLIQDNEELHTKLHRAIIEKSNGTFLWAALVFKEIEELRTYDEDVEILELLQEIPSGLIALYDRMVDQIDQLTRNDQHRCRSLLAVMATAYQPLDLGVTPIMAGLKDRLARSEPLKTLIKTCGSFLTVRDSVVYFVHQSAKDYLVGEGYHRIFQHGTEAIHRDLFCRSLDALGKPGRLRPNIYSLAYPGVRTHEVSIPQPDPLADIRYCCISWLRHFCDGFFGAHSTNGDLLEGVDKVLKFFKEHFLHWIETLSLLHSIQVGVISLQNLVKNLSHCPRTHESFEFCQDAARFVLHNRFILETAPLQTYVSALIFSPTQSPIRLHFIDKLSWIKTLPKVDDNWSSCLNTLYAPKIETVAFSSDSLRLTAAKYDGEARSWDIATGDAISDYEISSDTCYAASFSDDCTLLAMSSETKIIVWDIESGNLMLEVDCPSQLSTKSFFSTDNQSLATITDEEVVKFWDLSTGQLVREIPCGLSRCPIALSRDFKLLGTRTYEGVASEARKVMDVSDINTGNIVFEVEVEASVFDDHTEFSKDFLYLVSAGRDLQVWHLPSGAESITIKEYGKQLRSVAFSKDSALMALGFESGDVEVWSLDEEVKMGSYRGHTDGILSMAFSVDAKLLATASKDETVKVWATDLCGTHVDNLSDDVPSNCTFQRMALSDDRDYVAYDSEEGNINVWHRHKNRQLPGCRRSRSLPTANADGIPRWHWQGVPAISKDSRLVALECIYSAGQFCEQLHQIEVWDMDLRPITQIPLRKCFKGPWLNSQFDLAFFPNGDLLAAAHSHDEVTAVTIWRIDTGELVSVFDTSGPVRFYFHKANLCLATETGCYIIHRLDSGDAPLIQFTPTDDFPGFGYHLTSSENTYAGDWVSWNWKGMIWLPVDFRPRQSGSFAAVASEVVIGTARRDFVPFEFEEPPAELGDWTPWKTSGFL